MKKIIKLIILAACLAIAAPAMATPTIRVDQGDWQAGSGGEFKITVTSDGIPSQPNGSTFPSFCLETNEYISFGSTYYVVINDEAVNGGIGGQDPPGSNHDSLDPQTAWLYNEFLNGTLTGYDFDNTGIGHKKSAAALQQAIWFIEGEIRQPAPGTLADDFIELSKNQWVDIGDIYVMNLYKDSACTQYAQDQLVRITSHTPAPGAIVLGSIGVAFVGWLRRRRTL